MDISTPDIPSAVAGVAAALSHPQPMRRGLLYERRMRCGQVRIPVKWARVGAKRRWLPFTLDMWPT
jgi:hypothetical protein